MEWLDASTLLVLGGTALFVRWLLQEPPNLPPGPRRWPIVGSLPSAAKYPLDKGHLMMMEFKQKYGGIFSLKLGSMWMMVVSDPEIAREIFVKQASKFSDRPIYSSAMQKAKEMLGDFGVVWASGDNKKEIRKFTLSAMREFGFGKRTLIDRITEETRYMLDAMEKQDGQAFNPGEIMSKAISNIICSICFGDRYKYDDPEFIDLMTQLHKISETASFVQIGTVFEWLSWLPMDKKTKEHMEWHKGFDDNILKQIKRHEATFDPTQIRDFVDLYLKHKDDGSDLLTPDVMRCIVKDLYFAGTDTTSTAMSWLFKLLISHPEIQSKCVEEVDKVIGRERQPEMSDKNGMPFVEATINECLRLASIAPVSIPHYAMESGEVRGYTIPQGCNLLLGIYSMNMDPALWPEPREFRPERWLDPDTGHFRKNDNFLGFGIGPRVCLGESLSRQEMFLFFCSLLQRFSFHKESPDEELDFEGKQGITLQPTPYNLIAKRRQ